MNKLQHEEEDDFLRFFKEAYAKKVTKKIDIDTFIKEHNHINYCEAIIFESGEIGYVNPSHIETLLREVNSDRDKAYSLIPLDESPIEWLLDYTVAIAVWYNGYMLPCTGKPSKAALLSLKKLITENVIKDKNIRDRM